MSYLQALRRHNAHTVATCVCTCCGGALVERLGVVGCPRFCWPAGFVARTAVAQAEHDRLTREDDLRLAAGTRPAGTTPEQRAAGEALWAGEDA